MKKKISIIVLSILLISVFALSVSAAGVSANTESKSCAQGSTVTLNVALSSSVSVKSGAVEVAYDSTKLELVEAAWNTSGALLSTFDMDKGKGAFAYTSATSLSGTIFSVKFKVLASAPVGDTEVSCTLQLKDASDNSISVTNNSGKISVTCKHNFTEKTANHLASEATCTSAAEYYYTCSICGAKGSTTFTQGEKTPHTYNQKIAASQFLVNAVTCQDTAEYYYSCTCGAKGSEKFTADASFSHSYGEKLLIDADGHWYGCTACGAKKDYSAHTAHGGSCTVCGFVISDGAHTHDFTATKHSEVGHWSECGCGIKDNLSFHTYGDFTVDGDTQSRTCSVCGYVDTVAIPGTDEHIHSFTASNHDVTGHWDECECGEKSNLAFHTYGDFTVSGDKQCRTCSACGYVDTVPVEDNSDVQNSGKDTSEPNYTIIILSAVCASVLTIAVDLIVRAIVKKSKKNTAISDIEDNNDENSGNEDDEKEENADSNNDCEFIDGSEVK